MKKISWSKLWQYILLLPIIWMTINIIKGQSIFWLHNVDLFFHEAGHTFFYFVGEEASFFGGTLAQILAPLIFMLYFVFSRKYYSASIIFWWLGESLSDVGKYIADARDQKIPLIGGQHDWTYLLLKWNLIMHDKQIGSIVWSVGVVFMCLSIILAIIFINKSNKFESENF